MPFMAMGWMWFDCVLAIGIAQWSIIENPPGLKFPLFFTPPNGAYAEAPVVGVFQLIMPASMV